MAIGIFNGQEEKAIPYAKRWAELDPEDEDAVTVIKECEAKSQSVSHQIRHQLRMRIRQACSQDQFCCQKANGIENQLMADLENIDVDDDQKNDTERPDVLLITLGDMIGASTLMRSPVPPGEAEECAENNYMWPDAAVKVAKEHAAHNPCGSDFNGRGICSSEVAFTPSWFVHMCRQAHATCMYASGVVFEPSFYEEMAGIM